MSANYKKLGDIVELIDERNKSLESSEVLGISIDKEFMPSVANTIGTDLSNYKLLRMNTFACNPMHVGRDERLPVSLYKKDIPAIVSPAYFMFRVKDETEVLPDFLMLIFKRDDFDRNCWFRTDGSVRGGITWNDICEIELLIPGLKEQEKIVNTYNAITKRIQLKQKINENLEKTAQTIYRRNVLNKNNINFIPIGSFGKVITGKTPSTERLDYYGKDIPFIKTPDMHDGIFVTTVGSKLSKIGADSQSTKYIKQSSVVVACIGVGIGEVAITTEISQTNQQINSVETNYPFVLYFGIRNSYEKLHAAGVGGSTMPNLNRTDFEKFLIPAPPKKDMERINSILQRTCEQVCLNQKEIDQLIDFRQLIISRISGDRKYE